MLSTNGVEDVIMIEICIPRILHVRIESSDDEQSVREIIIPTRHQPNP